MKINKFETSNKIKLECSNKKVCKYFETFDLNDEIELDRFEGRRHNYCIICRDGELVPELKFFS